MNEYSAYSLQKGMDPKLLTYSGICASIVMHTDNDYAKENQQFHELHYDTDPCINPINRKRNFDNLSSFDLTGMLM